MAKLISSLNVGDKVKFGKIFGVPIRWIVLDKNHSGYPADSVTLLAEKVVRITPYDAKEEGGSSSNSRYAYGNNTYELSNLDQWLNKDGAANAWYAPTHAADKPPTDDRMYMVFGNGYVDAPAFLNQFTTEEKNAILTSTISVSVGSIKRKVFLLSTSEVGIDEGSYMGPWFSYFKNDQARIAKMTHECFVNSDVMSGAEDQNVAWWTRNPFNGDSPYDGTGVYLVQSNGSYGTYLANDPRIMGCRPALNLPNNARIRDTIDADGAYQIIFNEPPTPPNGITVPELILGGKNVTISWGAATDVDNNLAGYQLDRQINGGAYQQVYRGALQQFTDNIPFGSVNVTYHVAAYDAYGLSSTYTDGPTRTITNNTAPAISGADGDIGTFSTSFTAQAYTVTDAQGGTVSVVERFDGVVKRTYNATLGASNSFNFTADEWRQVLNGSHTITITATDNYGYETVRTWTLKKAVNTLTFSLNPPLPADAIITKCLVGASGSFPPSTTLKVEVCNNGNDAAPTWEDVSLKLNKKHFFANTTKTAAAWAFGLRLTLTRGNAVGAVYLDYVNINYA